MFLVKWRIIRILSMKQGSQNNDRPYNKPAKQGTTNWQRQKMHNGYDCISKLRHARNHANSATLSREATEASSGGNNAIKPEQHTRYVRANQEMGGPTWSFGTTHLRKHSECINTGSLILLHTENFIFGTYININGGPTIPSEEKVLEHLGRHSCTHLISSQHFASLSSRHWRAGFVPQHGCCSSALQSSAKWKTQPKAPFHSCKRHFGNAQTLGNIVVAMVWLWDCLNPLSFRS